MRTIGIIGGMGPLATADLFTKIINLTPAKKDQDHIHIIIDNNTEIPDRTVAIIRGGEDPLPYMIDSAKKLEKAGAEALIMPCNTAHYFLDEIQKTVKIPFISIIEATVSKIKPDQKNVCVIATEGTIKSKVYEDKIVKKNFNVVKITDQLESYVMDCIYKGVKAGKTKEYVTIFQKTIDEIQRRYNPDVFIAACTEIPVFLPLVETKTPFIDATLALAEETVKFAIK